MYLVLCNSVASTFRVSLHRILTSSPGRFYKQKEPERWGDRRKKRGNSQLLFVGSYCHHLSMSGNQFQHADLFYCSYSDYHSQAVLSTLTSSLGSSYSNLFPLPPALCWQLLPALPACVLLSISGGSKILQHLGSKFPILSFPI